MTQDIEKVYHQISELAEKYNVQKVVLFGSRARGDNDPKSDIDLAVFGCSKFNELKLAIDEELWSLLSVDIIDMESNYISQELRNEIRKDGVILYEKV